MQVKLVNASCNHSGVLSDTWYLPLGLVHIASFLEENGIDVEIIDGVVLGLEQTLKKCDGNVVGINFNCFNISAMEDVARKAKSNKAFTVLGGHAASAMAELLLKQNNDVDAVVVGDGEWSMLKLVQSLSTDKDLSTVPNLVYRAGSKIYTNPRYEMPLSELPMPKRDVGGLNPESYILNYEKSCSDPIRQGRRPMNVVTRKGCPRRASNRGCSFCARMDNKVRVRTPMQAWQEYKYLVEEFGADYLYEDSDSWINVPWLRKLDDIWQKNGGLPVKFRVYGDIRDITEQSAELLRRLNVDTVLTGIESGDRNVLIQNGKDFAWHDVEKACGFLSDAGISITDAYVLGLAGESWQSIERTIDLSKRIRSICDVYTTYWNVMLPLPGSPSWRMLLERTPLASNISDTYKLDAPLVREEFFRYCTLLGENATGKLENLRAELCKSISMPVGEYIR